MNMVQVTRRTFLAGTSAGALALFLPGRAGAAEHNFRMGAQSYSFRAFDLAGAIEQLKACGLNYMEFFSGHIPPDVEDPAFAAAKAIIDGSGIKAVAFGVEGYGEDEEANRKKFEFGKALGLEVLTANPSPESFDNLERLTEEYGIKIAIHNHGPGARYDKVADTLAAVEGRSPLIGACVDTGHVIRSGEKPHDVIEQLGDRVLSLHLKDWVHGGEEQAVGEGDMDVEKVASALYAMNFDGPIMLEYELQPENPVPGMQQGLLNWHAVLEEAQAEAEA